MKYIIGIDVGGTNTDIVLIDSNKKIINVYIFLLEQHLQLML
jgi:N-methylhydantoinase A/oxoprolinase/acetone carboxylase beta subunit